MTKPRLAATIDGRPLGEEEARALWVEFSAHMEEHQGDFAGFAKKKDCVSAAPEYRSGQAVLVLRTKAEKARAPTLQRRARRR